MVSGAGGATSSICPSGAARATAFAPMFMPPPAMFSTTVGLPHLRASWSATTRASVSVVEPAAAGTTNFTT
jgi:hypothetical protein